MVTLNQLARQELDELKRFKPTPCVVCGTTKQSPRHSTSEGILCVTCYLRALSLGIRMLKDETGA